MLYCSTCHFNGKLCIRVIMKVRALGSTQVMPCYDNDYLCSNDFTSSLRAVKPNFAWPFDTTGSASVLCVAFHRRSSKVGPWDGLVLTKTLIFSFIGCEGKFLVGWDSPLMSVSAWSLARQQQVPELEVYSI